MIQTITKENPTINSPSNLGIAEKPVTLRGRVVRFIKAIYHATIYRLFKTKCYQATDKGQLSADKKKTYTTPGASQISVTFKDETPTLQVEKSTLAQQIQQAKDFHQQEENALNYIRCFRAKQTIGLIKEDLDRFDLILRKPNNETFIPKETFESFIRDKLELNAFLEAKQTILEAKLTTQEIDHHLNDLFQHIQAFHQRVKAVSGDIASGSPERKDFIRLAKVFVEHVHKEVNKYKTPSSDPYLSILQQNKQKAAQALNELLTLQQC